jgi:hypothetical protein
MNKRITIIKLLLYIIIAVFLIASLNSTVYGQIPVGSTSKTQALLNEPIDISGEEAAIPHIALAQSTAQMDWSKLDLIVYATNSKKVKGLICLPSENLLHEISLVKKDNHFIMETDSYGGKVSRTVRLYSK